MIKKSVIFLIYTCMLFIFQDMLMAQVHIPLSIDTVNKPSCNVLFTFKQDTKTVATPKGTYTVDSIVYFRSDAKNLIKKISLNNALLAPGVYVVKVKFKNAQNERGDYAGNPFETDTVLAVTPFADFQVTQEDASDNKNIKATLTALCKNCSKYEWTVLNSKKTAVSGSPIPPKSIYNIPAGIYSIKLKTFLGQCTDSVTLTTVITLTELAENDAYNSFPNVFTPNGDGQNDYFTIPTPIKSYKENEAKNEYTLEVYNRGGQLIFKSVSPTIQWDGRTLNGDMVKEGQYFYTVKLNGEFFPVGSKKKQVHPLMIYK